jgi:hypothetical protein
MNPQFAQHAYNTVQVYMSEKACTHEQMFVFTCRNSAKSLNFLIDFSWAMESYV